MYHDELVRDWSCGIVFVVALFAVASCANPSSVPDRIILRGNFSGITNPSSIALDEGRNFVVANSLGGKHRHVRSRRRRPIAVVFLAAGLERAIAGIRRANSLHRSAGVGGWVCLTVTPPVIYLADYRATAFYMIRTAGTS